MSKPDVSRMGIETITRYELKHVPTGKKTDFGKDIERGAMVPVTETKRTGVLTVDEAKTLPPLKWIDYGNKMMSSYDGYRVFIVKADYESLREYDLQRVAQAGEPEQEPPAHPDPVPVSAPQPRRRGRPRKRQHGIGEGTGKSTELDT